MGYHCYFSLEIFDNDKEKYLKGEEKHQIIQEIYDDKEMDPHGSSQHAIDLDGNCKGEAKWSDFYCHMIKISKDHPNLAFIMSIEPYAPDPEEESEVCFAFENGIVQNI